MARRATVKKTYNLPPELVQRAKRVLKARTETEAIVISLEDAVFMADVEKAVRSASRALPKFRPLR
jgi:citrate lyase beta subunit